MGSKYVKINAPFITDEEINEVIETLRSGYLASGPKVREFEELFAKYLGVKYALTVSNGTIALYLALKALGIGEGDEVIVPDFTFFATASTVVLCGAKPVFSDINLRTYTIDPNALEELITERTKAVVVVHLYGHPVNMDGVLKVARDYGLYVIEDCAQAHGAEFRGSKVGGLGDVGAFSFYATKNLTMGEGGAVVTNNDEVARYVSLLRNHGQDRKYHHILIGWNFRITDIQAAIGIHQLRKLDGMNRRRRELAKVYNEELSDLDGISLPIEESWGKHVYHQYVIWVKGGEVVRAKLMSYLDSKGVQTAIHYPEPLHAQPALSKYAVGVKCPNATKASKHVLSLPMHPGLSIDDVLYVCKCVKEFFKYFSK